MVRIGKERHRTVRTIITIPTLRRRIIRSPTPIRTRQVKRTGIGSVVFRVDANVKLVFRCQVAAERYAADRYRQWYAVGDVPLVGCL